MNRRQKESERARKRHARASSSEPSTKLTARSGSDKCPTEQETEPQPEEQQMYKCLGSTGKVKTPNSGQQQSYNSFEMFPDISPQTVFEGELDIRVLDCFTSLLKRQFNVTFGLVEPSYLYAKLLAREHLSETEKIPRNVFAVQIHYLDEHYVVSCQRGNIITVYDSLPCPQRVKRILPQLTLIYKSRQTEPEAQIKYVVPQNQGISNDCGPFALFNTVTLLRDRLPEFQIAKQSEMRVHLHRCLTNGVMSDFPTCTGSLLSSYFMDQEHKHLKKKNQSRSINISDITQKEGKPTKLDRTNNQDTERQKKYRQQLSFDKKQELKDRDAARKRQVRQNLTECERETIKKVDTCKKAAHRELISESVKERIRNKEKNLRATHRRNMCEKERQKIRQKDTFNRVAQRKDLCGNKRQKIKQKETVDRAAQRKDLCEIERQKIKQKETVNRAAQRKELCEIETQKIRQKETVNRAAQRKVLSGSERQKIRQKETLNRAAQRKDLCEIETHKIRKKETVNRAAQRKDLSGNERKKIRKRETVSRAAQRKDLCGSERQKIRLKDTVSRAAQRKDLSRSERQKIRQKETVNRAAQRKYLCGSERQKIRQKDTVNRVAQRKDLSEIERQRVRQKETVNRAAQRKDLCGIERQKIRQKDTVNRAAQRKVLCGIERQKIRQKDTVNRAAQRKYLCGSERQKIRQKETLNRVAQRKDLSENERQKIRQKDTTQRAVSRQNLGETEKQRIKNIQTTKKASDKQKINSSIDLTMKHFFKVINEGPVYVCFCCDRFLYKSSVLRFKPEKYQISPAYIKCVGKNVSTDEKWICMTCSETLKKKKIPQQAKANKLEVDHIPPELQGLGNLERQLICKIIPFMKLVALPKGSQHGLKGQVVLVASDTDKIAASLPRQTTEAQIIALNLKRRLSDESAYARQYICPITVNRAFKCLQEANPHYASVLQNQHWTELSETNDEQLWNSVRNNHRVSETMETAETDEQQMDQTNSEEIIDSEDDVENDNPAEFVQNLNFKRSLSSVTCIYPENGPTVKSNEILNIAPAEGKCPTSVFQQPHWETLAFPTLFPSGKNTFHEEREVPISPKKYVNSRLLSSSTRFAENVEYTFQCLHWIETTNVKDTVTMSLKKSRMSDLTVGEIQNKESLINLFKDDEIFASFRKVRGSPQYWHEMQYDMLAKIRHFGTYTFFVSGSAADFHWPELVRIVAQQYGEQLDLEYIQNQMDAKTKRNWLARNPVTVARHIDFIFRKVWKNVILSGLHPIGQILNYDIRKEMQSRGTAHFHSAVHVYGAPKIDKSPDDEVVSFIDKHISCGIPTEDNDSELRDLVLSRQTHHHTRTCKKKKENNCRFHFPKPPSTQTIIARTVGAEDKHRLEKARNTISCVMETMQRTGTDITYSELLGEAHVSDIDYKESLIVALKKTTVLMERKPNETHVNPYNPIILKALRANMDIQFISDVWACVAYITSYMCKPERNMSDLMRNACKEAGSIKDKLKSIGNVFLKSREVSQHEAISRIIGLPLRESNTPVIFVPTGFQNERTRMLKPTAFLKNMDEDDTDVFVPNILDKYAARPHKLGDMCLAEFASNYTIPWKCNTKQNGHDENEDDDDVHVEKSVKTIQLLNGLGQMTKRSTPQVIRYHYVSHSRDPEKYFYRLLLLYCPWRNETELNENGTYESKYEAVHDTIVKNIDRYEPYLQQVEEASEQAAQLEDADGEIWDHLAPEANVNEEDEVQQDPDHQLGDIDNLCPDQIAQADFDKTCSGSSKKHYVTASVNIVETGKYYSMVRSLNYKQRQIHDHIFNWCREMALANSPDDEPNPFHIFLSGGGGVGKSHTVHTVYQTALRELRKSGDSSYLPYVVLTAPTGKAALNISGNTLHSAFHLPVKQKRTPQGFKPPAAPLLNSMRATYCHLKILVIDEVSMVSAQTLSDLDLTLQHVFENDKPFGGIAVLAVGDLLQLDPVADKSVFKGNTKGYSALAPNIWLLFQLHELTEIVRQKEDPEFAELLSRVRVGEHTDKDIQELRNLQYNESIPSDSFGIYLTNALKDQYNSKQLMSLHTQIFTVKARDTKKDIHTHRVSVTVSSTNPHETGGLAAEVQIAEKARYMHTKNTDIEDGLVNGAMGTIEKIELDKHSPLKGILYVKFDDPRVGAQSKKKSKYRHLVPIQPVTAIFMLSGSKSVMVERTQYPGTLAWGITTHKAQGSTFTYMVADMTLGEKQTTTQPGQIYTMLSRCKTKKGMKIVAFEPSKLKVNKQALLEMTRLQQHILIIQPKHVTQVDNNITITYLNTRSLQAHYVDILAERNIQLSDIVCLTETHVSNYKNYEIAGMQCISEVSKHGCAIYSGKPVICHLKVPKCLVVQSVGIVTSNILLICIYIPPNSRWQSVKKDMCDIIQFCSDQVVQYKCKTTLLLGDFNLEFKELSSLEKILHNKNLQQIISTPTHRLGAILDLVITDNSSLVVQNYPVYFSDHHLITIQIPRNIIYV